LSGAPVVFVGDPGSTCWAPRQYLLGNPVCCGWGLTGPDGARFRLVCPPWWAKRPACGRRSLLGTPVVLVGHPGSGFCARISRIARLGRSRDAGAHIFRRTSSSVGACWEVGPYRIFRSSHSFGLTSFRFPELGGGFLGRSSRLFPTPGGI
jgi:hypothetical protein